MLHRLNEYAERARMLAAIAHEWLEAGWVFDPSSDAYQQDPYPVYRSLREKRAVHRTRAGHGWVISRYEDVLALLKDGSLSADDRNFSEFERIRRRQVRNGLVEPGTFDEPSMLRSDPPDHTRLRSLVSRAFTPRAIEQLRPRVEGLVEERLAALERAEAPDLIRDLAVPLPMTVIAEMLGIPPEDGDRFKRWSDAVAATLGSPSFDELRAARTAEQELEAYLERVLAERRRAPRDDLLTTLLQAEEDGDRLTPQELIGTVVLLLVAGNETTTNLIGNGMLALLRHKDQLERLQADPELVPSAVEEMLRYDSPVQATSRFPTAPMDLHGKRLLPGQQLFVILASANRDAAVFAEPDAFDVGRAENPHLSFSWGRHHCLGARLARLEAQVAVAGLVERFPSMRLGTSPQSLRWRSNPILRGLTALPVQLR